jgi:hypothetical protein
MRVPRGLLRRLEAAEARALTTVVTWRPEDALWFGHAQVLAPGLTSAELDAWEAILGAVPAGQKLTPAAHHQVTCIFAEAEARRAASAGADMANRFFRELAQQHL